MSVRRFGPNDTLYAMPLKAMELFTVDDEEYIFV